VKNKINKILGVVLTLVLLSSFTAGLAIPASAAGEAWTVMPTPGVGQLGNYVTGPVAGVLAGPALLTKAIDGTLYAFWVIGEPDYIYKSTDGAHTWARCSGTSDDLSPAAGPVIAIVCSPNDAKTIYLLTDNLTVNEVYRSTDAGANFVRLLTPDQSGLPTSVMVARSATCMAVGYNGGSHFIYIGCTHAAGVNADVIMMKDAFGSGWGTTGFAALGHTAILGGVLAVATTPTFDTDAQPQVIAISNGPNLFGPFPPMCFVNWQYGGGAWSLDSFVIRNFFIEDNNAANVVAGVVAATIAFPDGYNSTNFLMDFFIGLAAGGTNNGDVYEQIGFSPIDKNIQAAGNPTNIFSLAVAGGTGSAYLLAAGPGTGIVPAGQNDIWHSEDNGDNWDASKKDVVCQTAGTAKFVVMADDYADSGKAWVAVASGALLDEASVAGTADFGVSWTDYSLINTNINIINNMEVSPDYANDGTVFIVTSVGAGGALDSLWKGTGTVAADGSYWMRVAVLPLGNAATAMVQCTPKYATDKTVFMVDTATAFGYRATDGGLWFKKQISAMPPLGGFGALLVTGPTNLSIGRGPAVLATLNNGTSWIPTFIAGATPPIQSLAIASNGHLLAGDSLGRVFRCTDGIGLNYFQLPLGVAIPGGGALNVAFDAGYATNNTVYAASAATDAVYRLVVGTDTSWERIDGLPVVTWPGVSTAGSAFNANPFYSGIKTAPDGALYVADSAAVGGGVAGGDAFNLTDTAGGDFGTLTVSTGSIVVANVSGTPIVAGTYAAGTTILWGTAAAGDAFSVTANAVGTTGVWGESAGTTVPVITSDADGDASAVLNFIPLTGSYSLPDITGAAGAANARVLLRSVNATGRTDIGRGVYFEPMAYGFAGNTANLRGVWCTAGSNVLFTLEGAANRIWTYTDNLTASPKLAEPADKSNTGRTTSAMLTWTALPNCPKYEIWVSQNDSFSPIIPGGAGFSDTTAWTATNLLSGVTYYWKVCSAASTVAAPNTGRALSPWSETWEFTTGISAAEWNPFSDAENVAPVPGASGVQLKPTFQWNPADWATAYEFELSTSPTTGADGFFSTALKSLKDLNNVTWQCDSDLNYSTTYYWHVRAISATSKSVWANGVFTTMDKPVPPPAPTPPVVIEQPAPITPAWIWAIVIIGAILVIAVVVLIVTTRRVP